MSKAYIDLQMNKNFEMQQFEKVSNELQFDNRLKTIDTKCYVKRQKSEDNEIVQLAGYEYLNSSAFHLIPEKKNTYHNYHVLQDNGDYCSMNHQIFMNHTKRNMSVVNNESSTATNINTIIPDVEPMYLKNNKCL